MRTALVAVPGGFGSVFKFGWLATNPSHKALDGRMRTQRFGCRVFIGQFLLAESPMQHPVTNNMNVVGRLAAVRTVRIVVRIKGLVIVASARDVPPCGIVIPAPRVQPIRAQHNIAQYLGLPMRARTGDAGVRPGGASKARSGQPDTFF